jgi:hypothetical protein
MRLIELPDSAGPGSEPGAKVVQLSHPAPVHAPAVSQLRCSPRRADETGHFSHNIPFPLLPRPWDPPLQLHTLDELFLGCPWLVGSIAAQNCNDSIDLVFVSASRTEEILRISDQGRRWGVQLEQQQPCDPYMRDRMWDFHGKTFKPGWLVLQSLPRFLFVASMRGLQYR